MSRGAFRLSAGSAVALALAASPQADAHHSFAMYDQSRIVTLKGTAKSFQWTNPHAILWVLTSKPGGGEPQLWSVELSTSPGNLSRMGWSKRSINPGDKVAVDINPLRNGKPGGSLKRVVLVDSGKVLTTTPVGAAKP